MFDADSRGVHDMKTYEKYMTKMCSCHVHSLFNAGLESAVDRMSFAILETKWQRIRTLKNHPNTSIVSVSRFRKCWPEYPRKYWLSDDKRDGR